MVTENTLSIVSKLRDPGHKSLIAPNDWVYEAEAGAAPLTAAQSEGPGALSYCTSHMTEVLRALCRHAPAAALCPVTSTTTPMASPSPSPSPPPPKTATYAEAVAAPDLVATPTADADECTSTNPLPPAKHANAHTPTPDLVFRLDGPSHVLPATAIRPHPARLFLNIRSALGDLRLAGICWTPKGNLTFAFHHDQNFTAEKAMSKVPAIWNLVQPLLELPKHWDPWHNVVIHGVPILPSPSAGPVDNVGPTEMWLRESGVRGVVEEVSVLCNDADLATRETTPLRISLSSKDDADLLLRTGALVFGSRCCIS
ncbi:hypothetical protein DFH08DRAFT_808697 [Mycena albidolilacea]|uniref:Uncharacterized protein n=1 Tax=Mycena albidolilacea TaxID=1033008 RepID=A0AAD7A360_9AGAR|nr:hypothetical protein DFH08DRAFT_808697 [Mycena albidolilacea]